MKSICFIGARGGSKGVPRKNIRLLNKKPLIAYTIESALKSGIFNHVVVSTEDPEIAKIIKTGSITDLIRHIKGAVALVKGSYLIPLNKKKETIKIKYWRFHF